MSKLTVNIHNNASENELKMKGEERLPNGNRVSIKY